MPDQPDEPRSLADLRMELAALVKRSVSNLTDIARIQLRIKELSERMAALSEKQSPSRDSAEGESGEQSS